MDPAAVDWTQVGSLLGAIITGALGSLGALKGYAWMKTPEPSIPQPEVSVADVVASVEALGAKMDRWREEDLERAAEHERTEQDLQRWEAITQALQDIRSTQDA